MQAMIAAAFALLLGLGAFTLEIANAPSYLFDDPDACLNCHVMRSEFASWHASQHRQPVVCNDCHVPHDLPDKLIFKALDGLRHGAVFSFSTAPENLRLREEGRSVVDANCRRCHAATVANMPPVGTSAVSTVTDPSRMADRSLSYTT